MAITDTNAILRAHLLTVALGIGGRIYVPRLPEGTTLPALSFFTRGGMSNPHIPPIPSPSVQFDCWGTTPIEARNLYNALYDEMQGLTGQAVVIGADTFRIVSAVEESTGQDLQDVDIPSYYRVLTFYKIDIQAEPI